MNEFKVMVPAAEAIGKIEVKSPFNGEIVGTVERIDDRGAEQALVNAHAVYLDKSRWLPAHERVAILDRTAQLMQENFDELVTIALSEGGKPLNDSRVEVARAIDGVNNCIECIRSDRGS